MLVYSCYCQMGVITMMSTSNTLTVTLAILAARMRTMKVNRSIIMFFVVYFVSAQSSRLGTNVKILFNFYVLDLMEFPVVSSVLFVFRMRK